MAMSYGGGVGSRIRRGTSVFVPALVCLFAVIATVMPYGAVGSIPLAPMFPLAAIYFFVLTRPSLMVPATAFSVGIFQDLLSGGPLGLWALVYLGCLGAGSALRLLFIGRSAGAAWPGFLVVAGISCGVIWILASLFYQTVIPMLPIAAQMLITVALYPLIAWFLTFFLDASED